MYTQSDDGPRGWKRVAYIEKCELNIVVKWCLAVLLVIRNKN